MMRRSFTAVLALCLALAACESAVSDDNGSGELMRRDWVAQSIDGKAVIDPGRVTLAFADGRVSGRGGCNLYSGPAEIGRGTRVAAGAVIGYRCMVGRDCYIGPGASVTHALLGNRVVIHAGVRIGQDGFGFAMGAHGHLKVPQIGRVIIQDDVEIGANTCVDRGALNDTVIGEGSKIDNLVQIGHNAVLGRHCVIVGQTGIAGSAVLEDFVVMGGQSGVVGHTRIGQGAQIAGGSHVKDDAKPGSRLIGTPARPIKDWLRENMVLQRLAAQAKDAPGSAGKDDGV